MIRRSTLSAAFLLACVCSPLQALAQEALATGDPATLLTLNDSYVENLFDSGNQPQNGLTAFTWLPDGRMVLVLKEGQIKVRTTDGTVVDAGSFTVDSDDEKGLLNVLPHPDFETNQLLFFYYSQSGGDDLVDKHRVVTAPIGLNNQVDTAAEDVLLNNIPGPLNHDGGGLALSPDGQYLYVSVGDTGCNSNSPPGGTVGNYFGTCLTNPNGKILRIGVDGSIPATNPLAAMAAVSACTSRCMTTAPSGTAAPRTEIWAWGFRNPYRIWTDPVTGYLWVGDVGESTYEEVNVVPPAGGKHYGWPFREGNAGQAATTCAGITPNVGDCVAPNYFCHHGAATTENGQAVDGDCVGMTGGVILDCAWPEALRNRYVFGDTDNGRLWTVAVTEDRTGIVPASRKDFVQPNSERIVFIATGPDKALYYSALSGHVTRIAPNQLGVCPAMPDAGVGGSGGAAGAGGSAGGAGTGGAAAGGAAAGGSGGSAGGATGSGGSGGTGGVGTTPKSSSGSAGGCGCRTTSAANGALAASALLAAGLAAGLRRRRR